MFRLSRPIQEASLAWSMSREHDGILALEKHLSSNPDDAFVCVLYSVFARWLITLLSYTNS